MAGKEKIAGSIAVTVEGKKTIIDCDKYVGIDDTDILTDMKFHSSYYMYIGKIYCDYEQMCSELEEDLSDVELRLYGKYKTILENRAQETKEKITENAIKSYVRDDLEFQDKRKELRAVSRTRKHLKALYDAMRHRRDMLTQINSTLKLELSLDM